MQQIVNASVLVGIVTRNRAEILPKAITSALAQRDVSIRVSVIDDGSTDKTPDVAKRFPPLEWIRWPQSQGYLAARNYWIQNAEEDYFVSLDDDAWFLDGDEISVAVSYLKANDSVAVVAFDILSPDRSDPAARGLPLSVANFVGCGHVLRLSAVRSVGAYERAPGGYGGEEKDLSLRLLDEEYSIVRLPGVYVWHDKTSIERKIAAQHQSGVCNDLAMTLRRTPFLLLPLALAVKSYRHLRFAVKNELVRPCLDGFRSFVSAIPVLWKTRKPVRVSTLRIFMALHKS